MTAYKQPEDRLASRGKNSTVRLYPAARLVIDKLAKELSEERGSSISASSVVAEALVYFNKHRPLP